MKKEHFEIILEDINNKVSAVVEGLQVVNNKIDDAKKEFKSEIKDLRDEMIVRFDYLDRKIDTKIDEVNRRMDRMENKMDRMENRMDRIEIKLDKVTENHEQRITKLEVQSI